MIYGELAVHIEDDQTDRIGFRTVVLRRDWQPSAWPLPMSELLAQTPDAPEMGPGYLLVGRQTRRTAGALRTFWTFDGIDGDGESVTFKGRGQSPDWRFEPGFAQVDILVHPKIQTYLKQFEGTLIDDQVFWPPTLSDGRLNPMFGQKDFFRIEGTYTYRYAARDESEIPDIAGVIFQPGHLPGRAKSYAGRNYLGVGAPYRRRGLAIDVQEIYWLSGPGGWPPIYGKSSQR